MYHSTLLGNPLVIRGLLINALIPREEKLRVYEAGGGSRTSLPHEILERSDITVVDVSQEQLDRCDYAQSKHQGSCETWQDPDSFDIVVSNFVLEHVADVESALRCFAKSMKVGGLLLIAVPRKYGLQGIVTRFTPHLFHVWYYKRTGRKNAGKPGYAPFPVHYSHGIVEKEMTPILNSENCEIICLVDYAGSHDAILNNTNWFVHRMYVFFCALVRAASLGFYDPRHSDVWVLARKISGPDHSSERA